MAHRQGTAGRPRGKTPAERADEASEVQRRLKQEAAERREAAARKSRPTERRHVGAPPGHGRTAGRRRTP